MLNVLFVECKTSLGWMSCVNVCCKVMLGSNDKYVYFCTEKTKTFKIWQGYTMFNYRCVEWLHKMYDLQKRKKRQCFLKCHDITKTRLFKYIENFTTKKGNFSDEILWHCAGISTGRHMALNIGCSEIKEILLGLVLKQRTNIRN